jgi:RHS repeat-associated protein
MFYNYDCARPHLLSYDSDSTVFQYDENGNLKSRIKGRRRAIGLAGLSPASAKSPYPDNCEMVYDEDNRLVKYTSFFLPDDVTIQVPLKYGWNSFSLPLLVSNNSIDFVLSSIKGKYSQVSYYTTSTNKWEHYLPDEPGYSQFSSFEPGRGYQIYVTQSTGCTLSITGQILQSNYSILLSKGWQMLGCVSKSRIKLSEAFSNFIKGRDYDRICRYDHASGSFIELSSEDYLEPGQACFIHILSVSLVWQVCPKGEVTEFVYDSEGNRVKKIVNGLTTVYIDNLYEVTGSLKTKHIFLGGQRVCSVTQNSSSRQILYYHTDHLGSTNAITSTGGKVVQSSQNTPYGSFSSNPTVRNPYLFTGKELDSTGLYYYGARYYDPVVGRFITADNFISKPYNPQYLNRYAYCMNNPLRYIDPTGNDSLDFASSHSWDNPFSSYSWGSFGSFASSFGSLSRYAFAGLDSLMFRSLEIGFDAAQQQFRNMSPTLIAGISNPFTQTTISTMTKGAGTYFGEWARTIEENAPGWTRGIARATNFQSAFQG